MFLIYLGLGTDVWLVVGMVGGGEDRDYFLGLDLIVYFGLKKRTQNHLTWA